ncbi:M16 family metallopeptidase [Leptolyngbya sp. NIES-2104]|uniref:M16 family metallopeptidase n=1 Tax=Leptolyngbya sp. NIES-2104 TaxID=1552121 RepID=UPI0006EC65B0|nr:pitrilysin family protein [Leptolyngbya sp. NIES-2104]GAP95458.1 processing proteinase [Leptolyngbya sp. NIES-2104]
MKLLRITTLFISALLFVLLSVHPAVADTPKHYTDLKFSPPPEIRVPDYTRFQLQNGMIVYLMEDHELPLVSGTAIVRTGDKFDPTNQVGLGELTGTLVRAGGTQKRTADQLNQLLEQRAAVIETGISTTAGSAGFNTLAEDLPEVFDLFAEVIQQPAFAEDKFAIAKVQLQGGIARRNDDPNGIAGREFQKLIYGDESPFARTIEYATIANVSRNDLIAFYQRSFRPDQMLLGIVGDFEPKQMRSLIEAKFGTWKPAAQAALPKPTPEPVKQAKQGGVFFVNQPQLNQSYIQMGHLGGTLNSPDYPALSVMEDVLSGFGRRLFNEVRSRQGLAYSVGASWSAQFDYPGVFIASGETRSDATVPFIRSVRQEIDRIRKEPISADELAFAKDTVLNSFIFNFQDPSQTLSRLLRYEYYGYPNDFIFQYRKAVEATSTSDVQRVAQKYLQPDKIVTLVVGNEKEIQPALSSLGQPVAAVDITIPKPQ